MSELASISGHRSKSIGDSRTLKPVLRSVVLPGRGLQLPSHLPYAKWLKIGNELSAVVDSSAWCLGDWLVYGETCFPGRYRRALEGTSLQYQTLRNYAWVARRIPASRRRDSLSFGHHAEVASLDEPEQEFWLKKAEQHEWSRNRLRREIRMSLVERSQECSAANRSDDAKSPDIIFQLPAEPVRMTRWERAARAEGVSLQEWMLRYLDRAAAAALGLSALVLVNHFPQVENRSSLLA
jgi:hypothetical protein